MTPDSFSSLTDRAVLQKTSLKDEVFELLQERIIAGVYAPGDWLRQEEIATQLGVSQTPVREALDLLVSAGLAVRVPYRGVQVPSLTADEIVDIYGLRLVLETAVVRLAAHNITSDQIEFLFDVTGQISRLSTLEDIPMHRQLNKVFHQTIAAAGGNQQLKAAYELISNKFPDWMLYDYIYRRAELLAPIFNKELSEHRAILQAVAGRDPDRAVQQSIIHLQGLRDDFASYLGVEKERLILVEQQLGILPKP